MIPWILFCMIFASSHTLKRTADFLWQYLLFSSVIPSHPAATESIRGLATRLKPQRESGWNGDPTWQFPARRGTCSRRIRHRVWRRLGALYPHQEQIHPIARLYFFTLSCLLLHVSADPALWGAYLTYNEFQQEGACPTPSNPAARELQTHEASSQLGIASKP